MNADRSCNYEVRLASGVEEGNRGEKYEDDTTELRIDLDKCENSSHGNRSVTEDRSEGVLVPWIAPSQNEQDQAKRRKKRTKKKAKQCDSVSELTGLSWTESLQSHESDEK